MLVVEAVLLTVMAASFGREAWRQRVFRARLPGERRVLHGHTVLVVPSRRSHAFCVGLLRPAWCCRTA